MTHHRRWIMVKETVTVIESNKRHGNDRPYISVDSLLGILTLRVVFDNVMMSKKEKNSTYFKEGIEDTDKFRPSLTSQPGWPTVHPHKTRKYE